MPPCASIARYRFDRSGPELRGSRRTPRRRHARLSPGRAGRRAQELGPRFPDLHDAQRRRDATIARSMRRPADRACRVCLELVGLWRRRRAPDAGRCDAPAGVAVRRDQAGRRASLPSLSRQSRRPDGVPCGTSPSTGPGSGPTWGSIGFSAPSWMGGRWCSTGMGCKPATSPSWPMRSPRPPRRQSAGRRAASTILAVVLASRFARCSNPCPRVGSAGTDRPAAGPKG